MSMNTSGVGQAKKSILPLPTPHKASSVASRKAKPIVKIAEDTVHWSSSPKVHSTASVFLAIANNHQKTLARTLDTGFSLDARDEAGNAAMHKAAFFNRVEIARELKRRGADVNARNHTRQTPLHKAAYQGNYSVVKTLIEELGADKTAKDRFGNTVLHSAVRSGNLKLINLLVKKHGLPLNAPDEAGNTALHKAAHHGDLITFRHLVRLGADTQAQNMRDETPVQLLKQARPKLTPMQLQKILNRPTGKKTAGNKPSGKAATSSPFSKVELKAPKALPSPNLVAQLEHFAEQEEGVEEFIPEAIQGSVHSAKAYETTESEGSDTDESSYPGDSQSSGSYASEDEGVSPRAALQSSSGTPPTPEETDASSESELEPEHPTFPLARTFEFHSTEELQRLKALPTNPKGKTDLHHAAAAGDVEAVLNLLDTRGRRPAFNIFIGNNEMGRAFVPLGQETNGINKADENGNTPLHDAVRHQQEEVARILVAHDANPFIPNKEGWTPVLRMPSLGQL